MSQSPSVGRSALKAFRLSDVPLEIRMKAAQKVADEVARSGIDPLEAIFETVKIDAIAQDPAAAAETMKADCQNDWRVVPMDEWEKATSPRRRW